MQKKKQSEKMNLNCKYAMTDTDSLTSDFYLCPPSVCNCILHVFKSLNIINWHHESSLYLSNPSIWLTLCLQGQAHVQLTRHSKTRLRANWVIQPLLSNTTSEHLSVKPGSWSLRSGSSTLTKQQIKTVQFILENHTDNFFCIFLQNRRYNF